MNPTELAILNRYSCRDFKDTRLSKEETDALLAAAMAAPTARNLQELRFNWIDDQELIQEISDLCFKQLDPEFLGRMQERGAKNLFYGAPQLLVISALPTPYAAMDAGIAAQSVCILAESMGLASCIIALSRKAFCRSNDEHFCERLNFAPEEEYMVSLALGHAATKKDPHSSKPEHIRRF
ncbi:MAG: nitroreductase family protein [Eubacteriales bacterium]|nr:nitroreductase family protein [Eubacteriales bacterium]